MAATRNVLKGALRKQMKAALKLISDETLQEQSKAVAAKVLSSDAFLEAEHISVYLSTYPELDTTQLLREMFRLQKVVFVPTYDGPKMKMVRLRDMDDYDSLPLTKWNIKQPDITDNREDALTNGHGIDLFLLPGVAFTRSGARLGHGMGYYDKYLRSHSETYPERNVILMALALNEQIVEEDQLPMEAHDVRLHLVVTENCDLK